MKNLNAQIAIDRLDAEAVRFKQLAKDTALSALHKSPDGRVINELDARLTRDHEIRAETYHAAAALLSARKG